MYQYAKKSGKIDGTTKILMGPLKADGTTKISIGPLNEFGTTKVSMGPLKVAGTTKLQFTRASLFELKAYRN